TPRLRSRISCAIRVSVRAIRSASMTTDIGSGTAENNAEYVSNGCDLCGERTTSGDERHEDLFAASRTALKSDGNLITSYLSWLATYLTGCSSVNAAPKRSVRAKPSMSRP